MQPVFHPFPCLPLELRLKIWSHLLPAPRIVDIVAVSAESEEGPQLANVPLAVPPHSRLTWVRSFVDHLQSPRQEASVLMHVNRETRALLLKKWRVVDWVEVLREKEMRKVGYDKSEGGESRKRKRGVQRSGWRATEELLAGQETLFYLYPGSTRAPPVLFNPDIDVLFLADPLSMRKMSSLAVLVRWLEKDVVETVRNLAVPYYSWRKDNTFGNLGVLEKFKRLERLWVCFVGDEGKKSAGWLAAVDRGEMDEEDEGERYLAEVREQIRGDIVMEKALVDWNRPITRVVKDKGIVMQQLRDGLERDAHMGKHECFPHCVCMRTPPERVTT
jgi:2EXR family